MFFNNLATEVSLLSILVRFAFNLAVLFILIFLIYYRYSKKEEYLFSYMLIGVVIFLITSLLNTVNIQLGLALGLFAVFAILRFRTVNYSVKDMTYVFTVIGISVINSQANIPPPLVGAIIVNSLILATTFGLEIFLQKKSLSSFTINYRKTELLKPAMKTELLRDLSDITGRSIVRVTIKEIDTGKGSAELEVFFRE
ncbi:MAG TPA: DUF4956 domain-containing protein [Bacteroidales bacterium]|nr:DUF4956 domain-containing protein [Bacteroidales bacterium]HRT89317.1 DUF4956 domain-containing protein [Bacteroidales bacterium]